MVVATGELVARPRLPAPRFGSLEAAAAPQVVVAPAPPGARGADPTPGVASAGGGTAADAVPLGSPWLPGALAAFAALRASALAARDAACPDPLDPHPPPRPAPPAGAPRPPGRGEPAAAWRARAPSALALASTPHPAIVEALGVVADAVADAQASGGSLDAGAALWAFALAANLERPLPADAAAALASLARAAGRAAVEDGGSDADAAARAAVVAAVAGGYWAQCASLAPAAAEEAP